MEGKTLALIVSGIILAIGLYFEYKLRKVSHSWTKIWIENATVNIRIDFIDKIARVFNKRVEFNLI